MIYSYKDNILNDIKISLSNLCEQLLMLRALSVPITVPKNNKDQLLPEYAQKFEYLLRQPSIKRRFFDNEMLLRKTKTTEVIDPELKYIELHIELSKGFLKLNCTLFSNTLNCELSYFHFSNRRQYHRMWVTQFELHKNKQQKYNISSTI